MCESCRPNLLDDFVFGLLGLVGDGTATVADMVS